MARIKRMHVLCCLVATVIIWWSVRAHQRDTEPVASKEQMEALSQKARAVISWARGVAEHAGTEFAAQLEFSVSPIGGLGMVASQYLAEGDLIMAIPRDALISQASAFKSAIGDILANKEIFRDETEQVAVFLMHERFNPESEWRHALALIPDEPASLLYYTSAEILAFQDIGLASFIIAEEEDMRYSYQHVLGHLKRKYPDVFGEAYTYELYKWAHLAFRTRRFLLEPEFGLGGVVMAPIADLMNHRDSPGCVGVTVEYDAKRQSMLFRAGQTYKKGEEIFLCYCPGTNRELLVNFGFTLDYNRFNRVSITKDPNILTTRPDLERFAIPGGQKEIKAQLVPLIKFLCGLDKDQPIDARCKEPAMKRISALLATYRTTYEDDTRLLKGTLTPHARTAITYRRSVKRTLRCTLTLIESPGAYCSEFRADPHLDEDPEETFGDPNEVDGVGGIDVQ